MILKYLGPEAFGDPPFKGEVPLQVGFPYEVAEILEMDDHLMCRVPGASKWPAPGDPMFGWHPELFEEPELPVEIVSCGYIESHVYSYWGVVINDQADVEKLRKYEAVYNDHIDPPDYPVMMTFEAWRAQMPDLSESVARVVFELECLPASMPEIAIVDDAVYPPELRTPFATVSYESNLMIRYDLTRRDAEARIRMFLVSLEIEPLPLEEVNFSYWRRHKVRFDSRFHSEI
ncbi:MAG: hypothetical protein B6D36_16930 [Planctomycetes bacterium UTPLA1]|jgi:hypothetical protein|nr:MAG: hypothetical protein B6D36_16930 [Planctomycetes bacterium UTPLA1]